jgi:Lipocalin-like domain
MTTEQIEVPKPATVVSSSAVTLADLVGVWELVSLSNTLADGSITEPLGRSPVGRLIYTSTGVMAAQLGASKRTKVGLDLEELLVFKQIPRRPWLAFGALGKLGALSRSLLGGIQCLAYSGRFSVVGGVVHHHVEISTFPDWEGTVLKREATLIGGGHLVLLARGALQVQRLVWRPTTTDPAQ